MSEDLVIVAECAIITDAAVMKWRHKRHSCWVSTTVWNTLSIVEGHQRERSNDL